MTSPAGKRQFMRARLDRTGTVTPVGGHGSHLLAALAMANCLVELPEEATDVAVGSHVQVRLLA